MQYLENDCDNELYHFGVKGMKWGVRHDRDRSHGSSFKVKAKRLSYKLGPSTSYRRKKVMGERANIYKKSKYYKKEKENLNKAKSYTSKGEKYADQLFKNNKINEYGEFDTNVMKSKDWKQMEKYYATANAYNEKAYKYQKKGFDYANAMIVKNYGKKYDNKRMIKDEDPETKGKKAVAAYLGVMGGLAAAIAISGHQRS